MPNSLLLSKRGGKGRSFARRLVADDRLSWQLLLRVDEEAPLDGEWVFLFGEAVHNLHSSLDNAVVGISRHVGITDPAALKRMQFPISTTATDWSKAKSRIKDLPTEFQSAIEAHRVKD